VIVFPAAMDEAGDALAEYLRTAQKGGSGEGVPEPGAVAEPAEFRAQGGPV
jgi:hypothetical protein